jgi:hypothetical protein
MRKRVDVITRCRLCELLAKDLTSANLRIIDFSPTLRGGVVRMAGPQTACELLITKPGGSG